MNNLGFLALERHRLMPRPSSKGAIEAIE